MKAAVLCPGPSFANADFAKLDHGIIIGVNRAPLIAFNQGSVKCHWWCAADNRLIETPEYRPPYELKLFTMFESARRMKIQPDLLWEDCFPRFGHDGIWELYSATAALVLAAHLGATTIDVFGADMHGTADADGHEYGFTGEDAKKTRSPERWEREAKRWAQTCDLLGVEVRRQA